MPAETEIQQVSAFVFLLKSGGITFLLLGLIMAAVGVVLAVRRTSRMTAVLFACISPLPGILALLAAYAAFRQFSDIASSPEPPKPSDLARSISYGMSAGFFGILGTVASMASAIAAFARAENTRQLPQSNH